MLLELLDEDVRATEAAVVERRSGGLDAGVCEMKEKIVQLKFTVENPDGSVNEQKLDALQRFAQSWGELKAFGAQEDELEALLGIWSAMADGRKVHVRGEIPKPALEKAFVDAQTRAIEQFVELGLSEQDVRLALELATARVFGRSA